MEKENIKTAYVYDLIALSHIIDDFDDFNKNLTTFIASKYNRDLIYKLGTVSDGKYCFNSGKVKKFYEENKSVIDTINKYSSINVFISCNYDSQGKPRNNDSLSFFYQYMKNNEDKLDQITALLDTFKNLGFEKIDFDESLDLSNVEGIVYKDFYRNFDIVYFDNIELIPNYESGFIKYRTLGSNYKMSLRARTLSEGFCEHSRNIIVNSFLFDSKTLPESITYESIIAPLFNLRNEQKDKYASVRSSIDLGVGVLDLYEHLAIIGDIVNNLDSAKNKSEIIEVFSDIRNSVGKLKVLSSEYDSNLSQKDSSITLETLSKEKKLYLEQRRFSGLHID